MEMAQIIAWHTTEDIKAIRDDDGIERLYVDGKHIPLTLSSHSPTQWVINYCSVGKRMQKKMREMWASL